MRADWIDHLLWVMLSVRNTPKEDLGESPASLTFSHSPLLPGSVISNTAPSHVSFQKFPRHHCAAPSHLPGIPHSLDSASHVFVWVDTYRALLDDPYHRPYPLLGHTDKTVTISLRGKPEIISVDRVMPAFLPSDVLPASSHGMPPSTPSVPLTPTPGDPVLPRAVTRSGHPVFTPAHFR